MRKYAFSCNLESVPRKAYDVVVIGSGIAGLYSALNIEQGMSCAVVNKMGMEESDSIYAQGGIAAVTLEEDSFEKHIEDTLTAGAGLCDKEAVGILVREGPGDIRELVKLGVPFDMGEDGEFSITREGAHTCNRVLHCFGDATGLHVTKTLLERAQERDNIHFLEKYMLVDILTDSGNSVCGVILEGGDGGLLRLDTSAVIMASGGIGGLYRNSTNALCLTGDGIAAAMRAGAFVENMEFIQFHPTALIHPDATGRYFLISEALRGEGGVLRNRKWEAFMRNVHPLADLAPRDIVSRAIISEMKKYDLPNVYLDITHMSRAFLKKRFPTIYNECMSRGIDIAVNWIPVVPVQHYFMGGIKTDVDARTNIKGLYACGETASVGIHGANRLASNSLLECLVFGRRAAQAVAIRPVGEPAYSAVPRPENTLDGSTVRTRIRNIMTQKGGILRNRTDMMEALEEIRKSYKTLSASNITAQNDFEALNMSMVAIAVLEAAIKREKSVGAHYRTDEQKQGLRMLNELLADEIIKTALLEDIGFGDVTTSAIVSADKEVSARFIAKEKGVICGIDVAERVFRIIGGNVAMEILIRDGCRAKKGDIIATVRGNARSILSGERVALNFLQRLSGIATRTSEFVSSINGTKAILADTRKTTPGLRALEKYAVKTGGGSNHRFGLSDGILIKDNHIAAAGGVTAAIAAVRKNAPHTLKIEVETENLDMVREALESGADVIMLDNMSIGDMKKAVEMIGGRVLVEASGNMGEKDLHEVAQTGVDIISVGALTHSVKAMDISLRFA